MATIKGGDKLQAALAGIAKALGDGTASVNVGFLENAKYPDGTSVALVAATQNFGSPKMGIPPRPFFSSMVKEKSPEWPDAIVKQLKKNKFDMKRTLTAVGMGIEGQLKQSIKDTNSPPLKPATIKRKGFAKPLVDSGHMLQSTGFEVKT